MATKKPPAPSSVMPQQLSVPLGYGVCHNAFTTPVLGLTVLTPSSRVTYNKPSDGLNTRWCMFLRPDATSVRDPSGEIFHNSFLFTSVTYRLPAPSSATPQGFCNPVATSLTTPAAVTFVTESVPCTATKALPTLSKTIPRGLRNNPPSLTHTDTPPAWAVPAPAKTSIASPMPPRRATHPPSPSNNTPCITKTPKTPSIRREMTPRRPEAETFFSPTSREPKPIDFLEGRTIIACEKPPGVMT